MQLRARGKAAYQEADALLDEIVAGTKPGTAIEVGGPKKVVLVDNFAEKNKVFRAHGIARYDLVEE
jgi:hypothetical protein